jgi:hypothetical protein
MSQSLLTLNVGNSSASKLRRVCTSQNVAATRSTMENDREMPPDRPRNEDELASILTTAYAHASSGDYDKAIELCDWLLQDSATEIAGRRQRSAVKTHWATLTAQLPIYKVFLKPTKWNRPTCMRWAFYFSKTDRPLKQSSGSVTL